MTVGFTFRVEQIQVDLCLGGAIIISLTLPHNSREVAKCSFLTLAIKYFYGQHKLMLTGKDSAEPYDANVETKAQTICEMHEGEGL